MIIVLCLVVLCVNVELSVGGIITYAGRIPRDQLKPIQCPDGSPGIARCNSSIPSACIFQTTPSVFYCHALSGTGVCCRMVVREGPSRYKPPRCPPRTYSVCTDRRRYKQCYGDLDCKNGQICCRHRCGRICKNPVYKELTS